MLNKMVIGSFVIEGVIIVLRKWKIIPKYEFHKKIWMPDWCTFCFGFWTGSVTMAIDQHLYAVHQLPLVVGIGLAVAAMVSLIDRLSS